MSGSALGLLSPDQIRTIMAQERTRLEVLCHGRSAIEQVAIAGRRQDELDARLAEATEFLRVVLDRHASSESST